LYTKLIDSTPKGQPFNQIKHRETTQKSIHELRSIRYAVNLFHQDVADAVSPGGYSLAHDVDPHIIAQYVHCGEVLVRTATD